MTGEDYRISARAYGPVTVISCRAERYPSAALEPVRQLAEEHTPEGSDAKIVFDLEGVLFVSTAILRVLAITHARVGKSGGRVAVVGAGEMVQNVLDVVKFAFVERFETLPEALAALSREAAAIHAREEGG